MIVLAVAASAIALAAQSNLPRLALDSYPAAARADIERAAALARSHPDDDQAVGGLARTLHAWEQWDAAHEAYTLASRLAPRRPDWPYLDAVVLQRLARPAEAVTRLRAALAIAPGDLPARLRLAETLLDAGELDASEQAFAALTEPAVEPAVQFGLGRIAAQRGQPSAAIPHLERAIKLFPEFGAAHYALARAYRAIGRTEDAQHEIDMHTRYGAAWPAVPDPILDAVRTSRQDAGALIQRGTRLADGGNVEGAIAAHEEALARDPSLAQAHANLIALYGRIHNWSKGEEHYRALIALGANGADPHTTMASCSASRRSGPRRQRPTVRRWRSIHITLRRTTTSVRSSNGSATSPRLRTSTASPSPANRHCALRASTSAACWWRRAGSTRQLPSSPN